MSRPDGNLFSKEPFNRAASYLPSEPNLPGRQGVGRYSRLFCRYGGFGVPSHRLKGLVEWRVHNMGRVVRQNLERRPGDNLKNGLLGATGFDKGIDLLIAGPAARFVDGFSEGSERFEFGVRN